VADHILEVRDGRVRLHVGDYESFLAGRDDGGARSEIGGASGAAESPDAERSGGARRDPDAKRREAERRNALYRATKELRQEVEVIEAALVSAEAEVAELTRTLADPDVYEDEERVKRLVAEHGVAKDRAAELLERWEDAQLRLEAAEREFATDGS
ncbi:MAG: hypothetical protein R3320_12545, partial [Nitriliruptorales bacterium]|nr:hypothetical protein [Nitriliruptorales bacterium]